MGILDTQNLVTDKNKEQIFFGEFSGFQRYDNPLYPFAVNMEERQRNAFWNPNEISLQKDSQTFFELPDHIQSVMIRIWLFQTLMDSCQNSGLESVLAELCTNSEFEAMFKTWGYFELIHSISYSHILRGIFNDSSAVFDELKNYPEIQKRIDREVHLYNRVKNIKSIRDLTEQRKLVLELLVSVFALEGVKFYTSFLVTYVVNDSYDSKIQGATRIIKLINFDEDVHTTMCNGLLDILRTSKKEGFTNLMDSKWYHDMVKNTFAQVYKDETKWSEYLLSFGDVPSLTTAVLDGFLRYYVDQRLVQLNEPKMFNQPSSDLVNFFNTYRDLNKDNSALQESDLSVYSVGIMQNDIPSGALPDDFFNLSPKNTKGHQA